MPREQIRQLFLDKPSDQKIFHELCIRLPRTTQFNWNSEALLDAGVLGRSRVYGIEAEGQLLAFVLSGVVDEETLEVYALATDPKMAGCGIMGKLLSWMFLQLPKMRWWLEVHESNQAAISLYLKFGFKITARRPAYYTDGAAALVMTRSNETLEVV